VKESGGEEKANREKKKEGCQRGAFMQRIPRGKKKRSHHNEGQGHELAERTNWDIFSREKRGLKMEPFGGRFIKRGGRKEGKTFESN